MILKPQDILVLLKLVSLGSRPWSYAALAVEMGMSPSQLHSAVKRAVSVQLANNLSNRIKPNIRNLEEFLVHGLKYVFVPERGELTRGMPTGVSASPLKEYFIDSTEPPSVWPDPKGEVRGLTFSPLYKLAPQAARADEKLYELLVLVDALRGGRAREREIASKELRTRLDRYT